MKITRRKFLVGAVIVTAAPALLSKQAAMTKQAIAAPADWIICTLKSNDGSTFERAMSAIEYLRGREFVYLGIRGIMTGFDIKDISGNLIHEGTFRNFYNMYPYDSLCIKRAFPNPA